jgi:hypothetical protein
MAKQIKKCLGYEMTWAALKGKICIPIPSGMPADMAFDK